MKKMVFKCYKEFYQDVFKEEDYEKIRLQVYRFLVDAAGDGAVGPMILPGSMKLGDERISVSLSITEGAGILFDSYREIKLLDRYLEITALKHDLSFEDMKLIFYIRQTYEGCTLKEMSEVTQIKQRKLILSIQKLMAKEIIRLKEPADLEKKKSDKKVELELLEGSEMIISALLAAKNTYLQVKYSGLTEEEIEQYEMLAEKMRANIQKAL